MDWSLRLVQGVGVAAAAVSLLGVLALLVQGEFFPGVSTPTARPTVTITAEPTVTITMTPPGAPTGPGPTSTPPTAEPTTTVDALVIPPTITIQQADSGGTDWTGVLVAGLGVLGGVLVALVTAGMRLWLHRQGVTGSE